jgi:hypothetical protein
MRSRLVLLSLVALLGLALLTLVAGRAALRATSSAPRVQADSLASSEDVRLEAEAERASKADAPRAPAEGTAAPAPAPTTRIEGLVVRPDGKPAALARVRYAQGQFEDSTVTDEQGKFVIDPPRVGPVGLVALHDDFAESAWVEVELAAGEQKRDLRLVLREFAHIKGLVLDGHNIARAKISVVCADWNSDKAYFCDSDGAGRFEFAKVVPGIEIVSLKLPAVELEEIRADAPYLANRLSRADQETRVEVAAGQIVEIVLGGIPADGVRVFGKVSWGGKGLPRTWIWAESFRAEWSVIPRTRTDEHGQYEVWIPAQDTYDFHIVGAGGGLHLARREVVGAEHEQRIDFDVPGGSIRGRVVETGGRPVPGVRLDLDLQGQGFEPPLGSYIPYVPFCTADAEGGFDFVNLPEGRYELHAEPVSKPDAESAFARASVRDLVLADGASITGLEVVLTPGCTIRGVVRGAPESLARHIYVQAYDEGGRPVAGADTDPDGSFVLRGLVEGSYGLAAAVGQLCAPVCEPVRVLRDRESQVELTLVRGSQLRLVPKCPPGEQPSSLDLSIRDERRNQVWSSNSSAPLLDFGEFTLAPGTYRVEFSGLGGWTGAETVLLGTGVAARVEVALRHSK